VQNGDFSRGFEGWETWGDVTYDTTNGVLNFGRITGSNYAAAVHQWLSYPVAVGSALEGIVTLQNTGSTTKNVTISLANSVLICTFSLPPNSAAQTYTMRGTSTALWTNALLNIWTESPADNLKTIRVDDAVVRYRTDISPIGTECIAPTAPAITAQPQSQTINSGQTATLSVVASGTAPLTYNWYRGAVGTTSAPVGTNNASFTTPALTQTTTYWARVSNGAGFVNSAAATITINTAPTISNITDKTTDFNTEISGIAFTVGDAQTAVASLTVSGTSSNTTLVPNDSIVFGGSDTNRTVAITPAADQMGTTTITITVSDGSLSASDTFVLTVTAPATPPTITTQPQSPTINSGQTTTLRVVATGTAPLAYLWYRGAAGDTSTPVGTNSASFTTPALTKTTTYWVHVSNSAGSEDSTDATITVLPVQSGPNEGPKINLVESFTITKSWQPLESTMQYQVQVATSDKFLATGIVVDQTISGTSIEITLSSEGRFYWRVRAKNFAGKWGNWSAVDSFVVVIP
jgi:hypothetical protein